LDDTSEKWWGRFNLTRALFWVAITPVAYFFGWLGIVTFVAVCSLYANAASDFAAYRADRNKTILLRLEAIECKLDEILETKGGTKIDN
jgi:hypothetical protein